MKASPKRLFGSNSCSARLLRQLCIAGVTPCASKFSSLRPLKRSGGRRYYRPNDVAVLRRIRQLLYVDGFTIKGAQKMVRSKASSTKPNALATASNASREDLAAAMAILDDVKSRLAALKRQLNH